MLESLVLASNMAKWQLIALSQIDNRGNEKKSSYYGLETDYRSRSGDGGDSITGYIHRNHKRERS